MAKLVADRGSDGRLRHVRDETFFAWRFRNPLCRYRFLFLETEDADLEGYLVLQTAVRRNRNEVRLVDWEARTPAGRETLLRTVVERLKPAEAAVWSATLPSEVKELLTRAGFEPVHRGAEELRPSILAKLVREDAHETDWKVAGRSLLDLASWDLRMIDSDNF
jgi:hypothetical protein